MLTADGPETVVELFHHDLPPERRTDHRAGWTTHLDRLAARFDRRAGPLT